MVRTIEASATGESGAPAVPIAPSGEKQDSSEAKARNCRAVTGESAAADANRSFKFQL